MRIVCFFLFVLRQGFTGVAEKEARRTRRLRAMAAAGFKIVNIRGDGNCLFRAASFLMFGDEDHHAEIRKGQWHTERTRNPGFKDAGSEVPSGGCN